MLRDVLLNKQLKTRTRSIPRIYSGHFCVFPCSVLYRVGGWPEYVCRYQRYQCQQNLHGTCVYMHVSECVAVCKCVSVSVCRPVDALSR